MPHNRLSPLIRPSPKHDIDAVDKHQRLDRFSCGQKERVRRTNAVQTSTATSQQLSKSRDRFPVYPPNQPLHVMRKRLKLRLQSSQRSDHYRIS